MSEDERAADLLGCAREVVTDEGHLLRREGVNWYAYPKVDPDSPGSSGGEVIFEEGAKRPRRFPSALDAYAACVDRRLAWLDAAPYRTAEGKE